jgi:N-methylhydantoinase B/oxoprolinase/acetone carboxylase alpha subunit
LVSVRAGDRLVAYGPGGGGYGESFARDPRKVLDDVLDGYGDADAAHAAYGVVIVDGALDEVATIRVRRDRHSAAMPQAASPRSPRRVGFDQLSHHSRALHRDQ